VSSELFQARVLGTSPDSIDTAENRYKFSRMLDTVDPPIQQPKWKELTELEVSGASCATPVFNCSLKKCSLFSEAVNVI